MTPSRMLVMALFIGSTASGAACTAQTTESAKRDADAVLDDAKAAGRKTADKTREVAGDIAETSKDVAAATGAAVTDSWVTAKLKAKFADETLLKGSDIDVDTASRIVTLKGSVPSAAARAKAAEIAIGTDGVTRVVNQLVVRSK